MIFNLLGVLRGGGVGVIFALAPASTYGIRVAHVMNNRKGQNKRDNCYIREQGIRKEQIVKKEEGYKGRNFFMYLDSIVGISAVLLYL